jgi:hypothetical protein
MGVRAMKRINTIRSKVAGVTFHNDDGSSRQRIIRKFCRDRKSLYVLPEPNNPYSKNAIGLWVRGTRLIVFPARYQVGYVNDELAAELTRFIHNGWGISARILEVTGGGWFRKPTRGVNIEITLEPVECAESDEKPQTLRRTRLPQAAGPSESLTVQPRMTSRDLITSLRAVLSWVGESSRLTTRRLLETYSALPRNYKIAFVGSSLCFGGFALWGLGYVLGQGSGALSVMRPVGVVTAIVGFGTFSVGIIFSATEPPKQVRG